MTTAILASLMLVLLGLVVWLIRVRRGLSREVDFHSHMNAGRKAFEEDDYERSKREYLKALAIAEAAGEDKMLVALCLHEMGTLYFVQGKYANARGLYQTSLRLLEKLSGPDHADLLDVLLRLSELAEVQGNKSEAWIFQNRVQDICRREQERADSIQGP